MYCPHCKLLSAYYYFFQCPCLTGVFVEVTRVWAIRLPLSLALPFYPNYFILSLGATALETFSTTIPGRENRKNSKSIKGLYVTICENGSEVARSKDSGYDNLAFEKNYPQFRSGNLNDENESKNLSGLRRTYR